MSPRNEPVRVGMAVVKPLLQARVKELARTLAPGGKTIDGVYKPRNPTRNDKKPGSFCVWLIGDAKGAWVDYATNERGDIVDLIQYCARLADRRAALAWAKEWIGGAAMSLPAGISANSPAIKREEKSGKVDEKKARSAAKWFASGDELEGSKGEAYLNARGIYAADESWPLALKYFPQMKHAQTGTSWHCIMAAMTDSAGTVQAVHRTFINQQGDDKAPVKPARLIWPAFRGAVVRLRSRPCERLILAEGVEDGLACMMGDFNASVWAVGSLGNFATIRVPDVAEVVVFADKDWGNAQAEAALQDGLAALRRQCARVLVAYSPIGKDANDALRA